MTPPRKASDGSRYLYDSFDAAAARIEVVGHLRDPRN